MDTSLVTVLIVIGALGVLAVLYKFFYRQRDTGGTDERNWVNDSNYNIASSDATTEAIKGASKKESENIIKSEKEGGPFPPSEGSFHDLRENLGSEPVDSEDLKDKLAKPR